ncbi:related to integral membrane protein PTH11 [Fusarium torulosum]|uniref:Related to integral membrane protein PTH11 n=1 Tax=Fusarium torulosum TaxID=33205 RepID=A0AAE8MLF9_9HYPO|nr:related to integral membrane protein PTH11 [Fusarium torulosum]
MKWIVPLLAVLLPCWATAAGISTKELLSELPQCARSCLGGAISKSECDSDDTKCVCTNEKVLPLASICVSEGCSVKEALTTQNWTNTYCNGPVRDKASSLIKLNIILGVFSGTSILLRIGSKIFFLHSDFGLDDLFTILSFCCCVPSIAIIIHGTAIYGLGRDIWTLEFDDITTFTFFFYLLEVLYFPLISLLKMSLLFFYLRIFSFGLAHKLLWGTIIFNALYGIIFVCLAAFQCNPISYFWTKWDGKHEGTCLNINAIGWANASISIVLDLWILAIPLWYLRSLNLHWKKKIGVAVMFLVGTFMTIVSIIRLQYLVNFGFSENPTYDETDISIWSTVEIHIGIICVSMPALRILLIRLFPALGGSSYNSSTYQNYREQCQNHALVEVPSWGGSISRPEHGGIEL